MKITEYRQGLGQALPAVANDPLVTRGGRALFSDGAGFEAAAISRLAEIR